MTFLYLLLALAVFGFLLVMINAVDRV